MEAIINALTNAGTGGLLGILGGGVSAYFKIKGMKAQAEIDRQMLELQIDKGTIEADAAAFKASQEAAGKEDESMIAISSIAETKGQKWLLLLLHAYKSLVRPTLAIGVHILAALIYFKMPEEFQEIILQQIFTIAFAYGGWYFGSRELNKRLFSEK